MQKNYDRPATLSWSSKVWLAEYLKTRNLQRCKASLLVLAPRARALREKFSDIKHLSPDDLSLVMHFEGARSAFKQLATSKNWQPIPESMFIKAKKPIAEADLLQELFRRTGVETVFDTALTRANPRVTFNELMMRSIGMETVAERATVLKAGLAFLKTQSEAITATVDKTLTDPTGTPFWSRPHTMRGGQSQYNVLRATYPAEYNDAVSTESNWNTVCDKYILRMNQRADTADRLSYAACFIDTTHCSTNLHSLIKCLTSDTHTIEETTKRTFNYSEELSNVPSICRVLDLAKREMYLMSSVARALVPLSTSGHTLSTLQTFKYLEDDPLFSTSLPSAWSDWCKTDSDIIRLSAKLQTYTAMSEIRPRTHALEYAVDFRQCQDTMKELLMRQAVIVVKKLRHFINERIKFIHKAVTFCRSIQRRRIVWALCHAERSQACYIRLAGEKCQTLLATKKDTFVRELDAYQCVHTGTYTFSVWNKQSRSKSDQVTPETLQANMLQAFGPVVTSC